jgi:hypothetical protein
MAKRAQKKQSTWVAVYAKRVEVLRQAFADGLDDLEPDRHGNEWLRNHHAKKVRYLGLMLLEDLFGTEHPMRVEFEKETRGFDVGGFLSARGVVDALETIVNDEWLNKTKAAIAGSMFTDYLDMAEHLSDRQMESAAVVIAMGSLEVHLRRLARDAGIAVDSTDKAGYTRPRAAESLNEDLKKAGVCDAAEQKQITAYLEIRKHAAHGQHDNVKPGSAERMIPWIRLFIKSHPA